ncbi:ATP synthase F1 subunit delta [Labilibaculum euxinus]|uniref:ATP synthase subunit delta n=1 Tax=Labilibaculum euxinus TaxID=2686357 RepID=A0A7M4D2R5_9BACT|nr:ATP synthase F1 subunit delta [Labilibaculum euxinus]MUP36944.1 ATP synthase F1 subunit delta [Labilibaculum euxinus]MVB06149.1 ATP synthase F1 subunit delta [Labilibaculum euxinus]
MNESKISVRYAKALFELGKEENLIESVIKDIQLVDEVCKTMPEFWLMVESPVVKTSQKRTSVKLIFGDKINPVSLNFLDLVVQNRREIYLKDISRNFLSLCRKDKGVLSATLTSASAIEKESNLKLSELLSKSFNAKIELQEVVDQEIIGGFVLRIEDQQLDASVSNQLNLIKRELLSNHMK